MQVTLETTSGLERRMRISVPAEQLDTQVAAKLKQAAGQVRIKGFRPGKVPMREVKRRFGDGIRQEVSSEVMQSSFLEAVEKESVSPAGTPQIEDVSMEAGKDLEFTAIFEVFPEISLSDFAEIAIDRPVSNITAEDVDKMIDTLVEQRTEFEEVDGACSEGDKVNVDFEGFVGKAEGSDLILGSGSMIPGFEDGIVGALKGEDKEVTVTFPDEYQSKDLAGKQALFKIKVNTVSAAVKPVLNDEFIENFGIKEGGIEAFRAEVTSNMERELESTIKNKVKNQVMDGLLASNTIDLPKALIEQEIDRQRHEAVNQFGGHDKIDPSMLPAEMFTVQAKKRVSLGLLVNAVIEQYDVKTDDDKVKETIEKMASSYEDPEQVINFYYSNEQQLAQIQNMVLEEQVVDTILAKAVVTDVEQGYDEAIKSAPQPVELPDDSSVDEETTDKTKGAGGDDDDTAGTSPS